jgi:hypothetical protein
MLLKSNFSDVPRILIALFWLTVLSLTGLALSQYQGQWQIYLLFTLSGNLLLYFGFRRNAIFFDTFIGILLWLGFWLKSSIRIAFMGGVIPGSGGFDGSASAFDHSLLISSCGLIAFVVASIIRSRFIFNYPTKNNDIGLTGLFGFYQKYRVYVLSAFALLVLVIAVSNIWFGIYQRGEIPRTVLPFGLSGVYSWLLLFGLASVSALILHFEFAMRRTTSVSVAMLAILETFASNTSMLSRGMILNGGALFYGGLRSIKIHATRSNLRFLVVIIVMLGSLFISSVFLANHLRAGGGMGEISVEEIANNNTSHKLAQLVLDRWVGIEGVMAVVSYSHTGWELWRTAWKEKLDMHQTSFFDQQLITSPYRNMDTNAHHYVSLPGIVAFFYYSGSTIFMFTCLLLLGLLAALVEWSVYKLGGRNIILCSLIAQVVAYRYMSFGYVPAHSYALFGSIYLNLFLIWFADWALRTFASVAGNNGAYK